LSLFKQSKKALTLVGGEFPASPKRYTKMKKKMISKPKTILSTNWPYFHESKASHIEMI